MDQAVNLNRFRPLFKISKLSILVNLIINMKLLEKSPRELVVVDIGSDNSISLMVVDTSGLPPAIKAILKLDPLVAITGSIRQLLQMQRLTTSVILQFKNLMILNVL